ncbi:hypothetical protein [Pseudomonas schmalbachii]|uniref:Uncharacterized protein n=1 Tax=Pseudomonas schmalbachii TaxID=2816993 RepID=A0ABS3TNK8_9PSED|nr:hypothetical protein [Pseudomonas schmalbachii]MBO3274154.1 hypothetical protein [Pseudomonas schmalbachii]
MKDFAKLFRSEGTGQVLAQIVDGDHGPEIQLCYEIDDLIRRVRMATFIDMPLGWDMARDALNMLDEAKALEIAREGQMASPFSMLPGRH